MDLMTVGEVAEMLGTCRQTVRRYAQSGRLPVVRFNARLHRFRRADVLKLVADALR